MSRFDSQWQSLLARFNPVKAVGVLTSAFAVTSLLFYLMHRMVIFEEPIEPDYAPVEAEVVAAAAPERQQLEQSQFKPERPELQSPPPAPLELEESGAKGIVMITGNEFKLTAGIGTGTDLDAPPGEPTLGMTGEILKNRDKQPLFVPLPVYPRKALVNSVSGFVDVVMTVTREGGVRDLMIVEERPVGFGFGQAALKAANKLRFSPSLVDGAPREVPGVHYEFEFAIAM